MTPDNDTVSTPATPDELLARLAALGLDVTTHHHAAVFTVEEAQARRGNLPGAHCKCLFLRDKKGAQFLVVCLDDRRLDLKALAAIIGAGRLSFGSPARLLAALGVTPGSVTPFATINDRGAGAVRVVLDAEMMAAPLVNYHPLINTMTTALTPADLGRFLADTGHRPLIADLGPATRPRQAENLASGR